MGNVRSNESVQMSYNFWLVFVLTSFTFTTYLYAHLGHQLATDDV